MESQAKRVLPRLNNRTFRPDHYCVYTVSCKRLRSRADLIPIIEQFDAEVLAVSAALGRG